MGTPGKRLPKSLDTNETREWVLNDRVANYFGVAATWYEDVVTYRTDDLTGKTFLDIPERVAQANAWGADIYLDMHHNAAGKVFSGGGVEAYSCPGSEEGRKYRDAIYNAVVEAGGLKGNRSNPLQEKRFDSLVLTNMPAVLIEYGYMDSTVDVPVILTDEYAKRVAFATMEAIANLHGLKKKDFPDPPEALKAAHEKVETVCEYTAEQFVRDVQAAIGAKVDGIAGPETMSKTVTVSDRKNSTHPVVVPLQKRLAALGYTEVGEADGIAGPLFTAAVVAYQEDHRCWVDGEITAGNNTWKKLLGMK
jgi:peptidoglycan hydrolase-like protein with peptidoglycan-binding domain